MTRHILSHRLVWNVYFTTYKDVCVVRHLHSGEALNARRVNGVHLVSSFKVLVCSWFSVLSVLWYIWLAAYSPPGTTESAPTSPLRCQRQP